LWGLWPKKAVVYDSFKNQYDCCSVWSFDPDNTAAPNDDRDDESDDDEIYPSAPHPPAPLDNEIYPSAPHPPVPLNKMVSGFVETFDNGPRDSSMDLFQANASAFPPQPSQTDTDMEPTDHAPSHGPSPGFPGIAPPVSQMDIIMETNDEIRDVDPTLPPSLPDITPPLSQADTIDETYQMDVNNSEDKRLNEDELFAVSKEDVLALNPLTPSVQPPPQPQFLEDLI